MDVIFKQDTERKQTFAEAAPLSRETDGGLTHPRDLGCGDFKPELGCVTGRLRQLIHARAQKNPADGRLLATWLAPAPSQQLWQSAP